MEMDLDELELVVVRVGNASWRDLNLLLEVFKLKFIEVMVYGKT